jgi:replication-associated recombination protein RarA
MPGDGSRPGARRSSTHFATGREAVGRRALDYDKSGDNHYHIISAYIKSLRGGDPDAALLWMVRMLDAGEDPMFIARRLVIQSSEDIGNADPHALPLAMAALQAVEKIGLPEAAIPLAQRRSMSQAAPKSNASYVALRRAAKHSPQGSHPPYRCTCARPACAAHASDWAKVQVTSIRTTSRATLHTGLPAARLETAGVL